jgi:hypothetical protein
MITPYLNRRHLMTAGLGTTLAINISGRGLAAIPIYEANVRHFGALGDGLTNDTIAIRAAHSAAAARGGAVIFPTGTYVFRGWTDTANTPVFWRSTDGARLVIGGDGLAFASKSRILPVTGGGLRGSMRFEVHGADTVKAGALVHITESVIVEKLRADAVACQTAHARSGSGGSIFLDRALLFDFPGDAPGIFCRIYDEPRIVRMSGLTFVAAPDNHIRALSLTGIASGLALDKCGLETMHHGDINVAPDGLMVQEAIGVVSQSLTITNCRYGYMISRGARDCTVAGVLATANRHPLYPAYWAQGCTFTDIIGRGNIATMDSHAAFDVAYERVTALDDLEMSNIRACGSRLVDANIRSHGTNSFIVAFQTWTKANEQQPGAHDAVFRNVRLEFLGPIPPNFAAVQVGGVRSVTLDRVSTLPAGLPVSISPSLPATALTRLGGNVRVVRE